MTLLDAAKLLSDQWFAASMILAAGVAVTTRATKFRRRFARFS